jgi:acyl dehydratase
VTAPTSPPVAGDQPEPLVDRALTVTDFVRYQGASADFNPIHHDQAFAAKAGFDKPFAVGMFAAGVMANYAADWLGPNNIRHYRVRFSEQAWPGDVLTYTGTVIEVRHGDTSDEVDVELQATTQTGSVHIRGWATFCLPAHVA